MPDGSSFIPEEYTHENGDFTEVHNSEFQDELREAGQEQMGEVGLEKSEDKEFELIPEIVAKIMEKVKDVDEYGTAFTVIDFFDQMDLDKETTALGKVLQYGFWGKGGFGTSSEDTSDLLKEWYKNARSHNSYDSLVYFNIVGRMEEVYYNDGYQIAQIMSSPHASCAIIFDISRMKEIDPNSLTGSEDEHSHGHVYNTFSANAQRLEGEKSYFFQNFVKRIKGEKAEMPLHKTGAVYPHRGFVTPYRVPPHLFQGIVTRLSNQEGIKMVIDQNITINKNRIDCLVPIYSSEGNLLWPRQMSYEEVKQFVADRDTKNGTQVELDSGSGTGMTEERGE